MDRFDLVGPMISLLACAKETRKLVHLLAQVVAPRGPEEEAGHQGGRCNTGAFQRLPELAIGLREVDVEAQIF